MKKYKYNKIKNINYKIKLWIQCYNMNKYLMN